MEIGIKQGLRYPCLSIVGWFLLVKVWVIRIMGVIIGVAVCILSFPGWPKQPLAVFISKRQGWIP